LGSFGTAAEDELPEDEPPLLLPLLPPEEAHVGPVIVLPSKVTVAADRPKNRPSKVAPVFIALTPFCDITVPINEVVVSRVVELPIRHHTLQGSPPVTDEPGEVMSVDTVLKIQTPEPTRVRFPLSEKLLVEHLAVDFFFFHDVFKTGEVTTLPQYLTGILSVPVFAVSVQSLLKP